MSPLLRGSCLSSRLEIRLITDRPIVNLNFSASFLSLGVLYQDKEVLVLDFFFPFLFLCFFFNFFSDLFFHTCFTCFLELNDKTPGSQCNATLIDSLLLFKTFHFSNFVSFLSLSRLLFRLFTARKSC